MIYIHNKYILMMKYLLCFLACYCTCFSAKAQQYEFVYYFDANLSFVNKETAVIIGKGYKADGLVAVDCFGKTTGKKMFTATFKDSSLQIMHGKYVSYYEEGFTESEGMYNDNEIDGVWKNRDKSGFLTDSTFYEKGIRTAFGKYRYGFNKWYRLLPPAADSIKRDGYRLSYSFTDSLKNTFYESEAEFKNDDRHVNFEVFFIGNRGLLKEYDSTGNVKTDSVFDRTLEEAAFSGGDEGWRRFLYKNIDIDIASKNKAPNGNHTAIIRFVVNTDGSVIDVTAESDPGYGVAAEVIRVIKLSGKWKPAKKYGKYIKSYRRQPMTFAVDNG